MSDRTRTTYALIVLFAINTMNFFDRQILGAVTEPVRKEWMLSDSAIGALGTAFTLLYAAVGLPLGRLTDRARRTTILAWGVFVWSALTAASGLARNYTHLFALRLGVGVGEATCAPAATSLIGDLYPAHKRARALSVFMLGLPVGIALSYAVSGSVAHSYGWRAAFYVAGIPGLLCALASDIFTGRAARAAGAVESTQQALEPFRAEGLHSAMYIIPILAVLLTLVLYAASRTVTGDMERLERWMRRSSEEEKEAVSAGL